MVRSNGRPAVVLLVEDDPDDRELTSRALQEDFVMTELHIVSDGEAAMEYLLQRGAYSPDTAPRPDLILLDLNLPKLNGHQILERVRAHPVLKGTPVIVLTTSSQQEDIVRSYDLGCNSFLTKPVEIETFIKAVRAFGKYWFELVALP